MATARLINNFLSDAKLDQNYVTTWMGVSSADGVTPLNITIDSVTGNVLLLADSMGTHSAVTNRQIAYRDENYVPVGLGESENDDGVLVNVIADSPGILRVKGV